MEQTGQFRFGDFLLDVTERCLYRDGETTYLPPRTFDTLLILLSRADQLVAKDDLMQTVWEGAVVTDNALTRCIKEVRQALGDDAKNPSFIETVPRVGYRFIAEVEQSSGPGDAESPSLETVAVGDIPETVSGKTTWGKPIGILFALIACLLLWILLKPYSGDQQKLVQDEVLPGNRTVAVLPFENHTQNDHLDYFADGVAEEVTDNLSLLDGLSVLSFNVSSRFRDSASDLRDIAHELGVRYIVYGSLRQVGENLRVSTSLVQAETGIQLWSMADETTVFEAYSIQDNITQGVVNAMTSELHSKWNGIPAYGKRQPDPEAYDLYLRGRYIWSRRGVQDMRAAVDMLSEAVRVDPEFARGWAALASAYIVWPTYSPEGYRTWHFARDAANKALELDESLAEPRAILANFKRLKRDWIGADKLIKEAVEIEPRNATLNYWYSEHLAKTGRYKESVARLAIARTLDPTYSPTLIDTVFSLALFGRTHEAVRVFEHAWNSGIRSPITINAGIISNILVKNYEQALALIDEVSAPEEQKRIMKEFIDVEAGRLDAQSFISQLENNRESWPHYVVFVWMLSRLGAMNLAVEILDQRIAAGRTVEPRILWGPGHHFITHDEFPRIAEDIGLSDYWNTVVQSDFCELVDSEWTCEAPQAGDAPDSINALLETLPF